MIDRALNISPVQQESFHFQLIPLTLYMINKESELPAKGTTYRFTVFKGTPPSLSWPEIWWEQNPPGG